MRGLRGGLRLRLGRALGNGRRSGGAPAAPPAPLPPRVQARERQAPRGRAPGRAPERGLGPPPPGPGGAGAGSGAATAAGGSGAVGAEGVAGAGRAVTGRPPASSASRISLSASSCAICPRRTMKFTTSRAASSENSAIPAAAWISPRIAPAILLPASRLIAWARAASSAAVSRGSAPRWPNPRFGGGGVGGPPSGFVDSSVLCARSAMICCSVRRRGGNAPGRIVKAVRRRPWAAPDIGKTRVSI